MNLFDALFLAVIQALTEFLPVSSSGHLVLAKTLLHVESPGAVWEVALHLGTLAAVFVVFRRDILRLVAGFFRGAGQACGKDGWRKTWRSNFDFRMMFYLIAGTIPAAIVGFLLRTSTQRLFSTPVLALAMLFITGELLWLTRAQRLYRPCGKVRLADAIIIGVAQACALLPGLSRSGATICFALFRGVEPQRAARFSFLLAIPAILGGALLEAPNLTALPPDQLPLLLTAVAVAALVGYAALRLLLGLLAAGRLHWFAWYCWGIAVAGTAWLWASRAS